MEAFLTTLSNFLTFLQQHFFPSFVFVILNEFIILPALSRALSQRGLMSISLPSDLLTGLGLAFIVAVALGYALESFNLPLIELFQGHPLRERLCGKWLTKRQRDRRSRLIQKLHSLEKQLEEQVVRLKEQASSYEIGSPEREKLYEQRRQLEEELVPAIEYCRKQLREKFPVSLELMPTRLGNIMAASYDHAFQRYRIDAVTLWPRMLPLLEQRGYDTIVKREKAKVDFFLDSCMLSAFFSIECVLIPLSGTSPWFLVVGALLSPATAYCFYQLAAAGAINWGRTVRAAFDLYRYNLLSDLYGPPPTDFEEERALWAQLSQFIREGETGTSTALDYPRIRKVVKESWLKIETVSKGK
jgi:hypothetical protein